MQYDKNLLTAILVIQPPGEKPRAKKYRNIKDGSYQLEKLERFARRFRYADHINLYRKGTKEFVRQIKL